MDSIPINVTIIRAVNESVNKVLRYECVNHRLDRFVEYLQQYFKTYPSEDVDPTKLNEFRPSKGKIDPREIIVKECKAAGGKLEYEIIDGVHRAVAIVLRGGCELLVAYEGRE